MGEVQEEVAAEENVHFTFTMPRYTSPSTILNDDFADMNLHRGIDEPEELSDEDATGGTGTSPLVLLSPPNRSINPPIRVQAEGDIFGTPGRFPHLYYTSQIFCFYLVSF